MEKKAMFEKKKCSIVTLWKMVLKYNSFTRWYSWVPCVPFVPRWDGLVQTAIQRTV